MFERGRCNAIGLNRQNAQILQRFEILRVSALFALAVPSRGYLELRDFVLSKPEFSNIRQRVQILDLLELLASIKMKIYESYSYAVSAKLEVIQLCKTF